MADQDKEKGVFSDGEKSKRIAEGAYTNSSPGGEAKDKPGKKSEENKGIGETKIWLQRIEDEIAAFCSKHKKIIKWAIIIVFIILYTVYLAFAIHHNFEKALPLLVITIVFCCGLLYCKVLKRFLIKPYKTYIYLPVANAFAKMWKYKVVRIVVYIIIALFFVIFLFVDTRKNPYRLVSLSGLVIYMIICVLFSLNPIKIRWRPVLWGIGLQFGIGFFLLRIPGFLTGFKFVADNVVDFLEYSNRGAAYVYGFLVTPPNICNMEDPIFAFKALQTITFVAAVIAVLYYYGIIQCLLLRIAWLVQSTLDTTAAETLYTVGCVFLGMTESLQIVKPYLAKMTKSEINAMFTAGFACISGSMFAAYVNFGVCALHLLTASFMSAPASIAVAKVLVPETEESHLRNEKDLDLPKSEEANVIEALRVGASSTVSVIWLIAANMIVYVALLHFFNNTIIWLGSLVGLHITFDKLLGFLFYPLAFVMGASDNPNWEQKHSETLIVAQLMGKKTVFNEFAAYQDMRTYSKRELGERAQMISTYALCGFSNIAGVGMQLGNFAALCPKKKNDMAEVIFRSLLGGSIACFMTACVAGILVDGSEFADLCPSSNGTARNCTTV